MPTLKLTDRHLNQKSPASGTLELWDTVTPGLALRIHSGGKRSWCITTRIHGRQVRRTIGSTATYKLAEARDLARDVLRDAQAGRDTFSKDARKQAAEQARREAERAQANTFRSVAEAWLADTGRKGGAELRSKAAIEKQLEADVYATLGAIPAPEIKRADVRDLVRDIAKTRPIAANRTLAIVRRALQWAVEQDKLDTNPAAGIDPPAQEQSRSRVLTEAELTRVWRAADTLGYPVGPWLKLMVLTGQRRTEVGGMRRPEINGNDWIIPATRTKNGREHIVPLAPIALEIIESVPRLDGGEHVFVSGRARTRDPEGQRITDRPMSGWGKVKARLDRAIAEAAAKAAKEKLDIEKHALPDWTFHDLRRTMVTVMNETLRIEPHVIEAVVNHVSGPAKAGVAGVYNRAQYLPQRREALTAWANYIVTLADKPAENVVRLRRGKK